MLMDNGVESVVLTLYEKAQVMLNDELLQIESIHLK